MGTALHTIRVDHFNLCYMLRRLLALCEILEPLNCEDLSGSIALTLQYIDSRTARDAGGGAETLLREALVQSAFDASPKGKIAPVEPRIRSKLRFELTKAFEALRRDCSQVQRFCAAARSYAEFERWRMTQFETQVIPLAFAALSPDDWRRVDAAVQRRKASAREASHDRVAEQLFRKAVKSARAAQRNATPRRSPASRLRPGYLPGRYRFRRS